MDVTPECNCGPENWSESKKFLFFLSVKSLWFGFAVI